ncbi:hypothetical protein WN943_023502 [Citrus x changshan-huyou]
MRKQTFLAQDLPWLLLPATKDNEDIKSFLSITTNKLHNFNLPAARGKTICGSSAGWLIMNDNVSTITLINPLSSAHFQLPQISTKKVLIHKAILSSDPECDPYNFVVTAICGEKRELIYYKARSESWETLEAAGFYYDDVISYEGRELFAVSDYGKVVCCKVDSLPRFKEIFMPFSFQGNKVYLVCVEGELFVIFRSLREHSLFCYETFKFSVSLLNVEEEISERIKSFPEVAFFLGQNHSVWLPADEDMQGVIGNRIYFTDDRNIGGVGSGGEGGHDFGCYDMEEVEAACVCTPAVQNKCTASVCSSYVTSTLQEVLAAVVKLAIEATITSRDMEKLRNNNTEETQGQDKSINGCYNGPDHNIKPISLKSNLKKTTTMELEAENQVMNEKTTGRRKVVTWPDAHGKDIAHVHEFEPG